MNSNRVAHTVEAHPIAALLVVSFGWSWVYYGVYLAVIESRVSGLSATLATYPPYAWGPLVGAVVVTWALRDDVRALLGQATNWRVSPRWYVVALVLPNAVQSVDVLAYLVTGVPLTVDFPLRRFLFLFFGVLLLAGSLEEFGWRGVLQPRLQERYGAGASAVAVGGAWSLWHVPQYLTGALGDMSFALYAVHLVAMSVVMAWLYNSAGLVPVMVFHAGHNAPGQFFSPVGPEPAWIAAFGFPMVVAAWVLVALAIAAHYGPDGLSRSAPAGTDPDEPIQSG